MSSKAITETPTATDPGGQRLANRDLAPSVLRDDDPGASRYLGFLGAFLVMFGGIFLTANLGFNRSPFIGPGWAAFLLALGLIALLSHAAFDSDVQFRRVYMAFSYAALLIGVFLCVLPYPNRMGDLFQIGFLCLSLALVFLLAFLRNETEAAFRELAQRILLGAGVLMMAVGLIGGSIKGDFLLPIGFELSLLGFVYVAAFVGSRGTSDDQAYYAGLGLGAVGVLVFLLAFVRSYFLKEAGGSYLLPNGLALMSLGVVAGVLSLMLVSESLLVVLTRRELGAFFYSPIAYFVVFAFTAVEAFVFGDWVGKLISIKEPIPEPVVSSFLLTIPTVVLVIGIVPILTMRLFSEEWRTGTLEVLLTSPVGEATVAISKFIAAYLIYLLVWVPFGLFLVALRSLGSTPFDYYPVISFGVAVAVSGAGFISMGVFFSSLTRNQLISGVLTMAGMILLTCLWFMKGRLMQESGEQVASKGWPLVLEHMAYLDLWIGGIVGVMYLKFMIFNASLTVFFQFLTVKVLEARKWL